MTKQIPSIALAGFVAAALVPSSELAAAQAKQKCSAAMPANPQGYWSWRLIDGRKCWYEGKPMLSKSLLNWPQQASARPDTNALDSNALIEVLNNPLDSQAWAPIEPVTFEALWRARAIH
jgi:hypothetical protein